MTNLGKQIMENRKQNGLSQEDLAKKLNVTRQAISNWERNKTEPDVQALTQLASLFGIDMNSLMTASKKSSKNAKSRSSFLLIVNIIVFITHVIFSILGYVPFISVFIAPALVTFLSFIISVAFNQSIKSNDFSMIAGYDKDKDNDFQVKKQLYSILFYTNIIAILCNGIFFMVYTLSDDQIMPATLIIAGVFIVGFVLVTIVANTKYKSRN